MVRESVIAYLERNGIKAKDIAEKCNISSGSVSSFFSNRYETNFEIVVRIVRNFLPEREEELIKKHCRTMEKPLNLRLSLEYAEFHKYYDLLEEMIEKQKDKSNKETKDWVKIYSLILHLKDDPEAMYNELRTVNVNTYEMRVLKGIILVRSLCLLKDFSHYSTTFFKELQRMIGNIEHPSLKKYFVARLSEFHGTIQLHKGNLKEARNCFEKLIELNADKKRTAQAYHGLGLSYLYEDYSQSMKLLKKSREIFSEISKEQAENVTRSINFVCCYWGKISEYVKIDDVTCEDLHEVAVIENITGNVSQAIQIVNAIDVGDKSTNKKAFHYYYKGKITKSKDALYKSVMYFKQCNDKFYGKLPCLELLKMGENKILVDALYGDHI